MLEFEQGIQSTLDYVKDIGGRVAVSKCILLATMARHRRSLRLRQWVAGATMSVRHHMRDLGAHLTLSGGSAGVTLSARSSGAAKALDRIRSLPIPAAKKATLIRGRAYAMGLYGVEGTPLNVSQGRMLRAKAADALVGKHQTMRSPEAALALVTARGLDLDTEVLWRRIRLLRRAWHVRPSWQQLIQQDYNDTLRWVQSLHTEDNGEGALGEGRSWAGILSKRGVRGQLKKGPIGLLFLSCLHAGAILQEGFILQFERERKLDILRDPVQRLRGQIMDRGRDSNMRSLAQRRKSFAHRGGIDWRASRVICAALSAEQRQDLLCIQSGGLWTAKQMKTAGLVDEDVCPWCKGAVEDLEHLWWRCPAFDAERRTALRELRFRYEEIPSALALHGLAPELAIDVGRGFWCFDEDDTAPGGDTGAAPERAHVPVWAAEEAGIPWAVARPCTFRQLLDSLAGPAPHYRPGPVPAITEQAPDDINCYTDGGLRFRPDGPAAIGNWGGIWTGPVIEEGADLLARSGWVEAGTQGTLFWGQLDGPAISSTRSEAWGIAAALLLPRPLHLGVDNKGAVQNLNRILAGGPNLTRKPWGMREDGDVWGVVHALVHQRGPAATKCTKVKGHATDQMVAGGKVRLVDQKGNAAADGAVGRGYASYGQHRRAPAAFFF